MSLKDLRRRKGFTQVSLAAKSGVNQQIISDYETGKRPCENMTVKTAISLLNALGEIDVRKLVDDVENERALHPIPGDTVLRTDADWDAFEHDMFGDQDDNEQMNAR